MFYFIALKLQTVTESTMEKHFVPAPLMKIVIRVLEKCSQDEQRARKAAITALSAALHSLWLSSIWAFHSAGFGWVILSFEVILGLSFTRRAYVGECLTSAELEKQQVPRLGCGFRTLPRRDLRRTWRRTLSCPLPEHTGEKNTWWMIWCRWTVRLSNVFFQIESRVYLVCW